MFGFVAYLRVWFERLLFTLRPGPSMRVHAYRLYP